MAHNVQRDGDIDLSYILGRIDGSLAARLPLHLYEDELRALLFVATEIYDKVRLLSYPGIYNDADLPQDLADVFNIMAGIVGAEHDRIDEWRFATGRWEDFPEEDQA